MGAVPEMVKVLPEPEMLVTTGATKLQWACIQPTALLEVLGALSGAIMPPETFGAIT